MGTKPGISYELKIDEDWVYTDLDTYGSTNVVPNADYNQLWIYSKGYSGFDGVSVEKIVIEETTSTGGRLGTNSSPIVFSLENSHFQKDQPQLPVKRIVYPNPTQGFIKILHNRPNYSISLKNLAGATVYAENFYVKAENIIDISSQPAGVYFLKISTNGGVQIEKIIKE